MEKLNSSMAQRIAEVANALEEQGTGHKPKSVTVVLSDNTLVITLHEALIAGRAGPVQEPGTADSLRQEIKRITEVEVRRRNRAGYRRRGEGVHDRNRGAGVPARSRPTPGNLERQPRTGQGARFLG